MKEPVVPPVLVETESRADLETVRRHGESLTDFASRCDASLAEYERTGVSIPAAQVIAKLESKLAERRRQLGE